MKILIIEDDPAISQLLERGLRDAGYAVDLAADGPSGLKAALENVYNLILLDIMLPGGIDGWEVCRRLRRDHVVTPVLMLTACDTPREAIAGLDAGADDYQSKPFDFGELLARVRALLRRDKVNRTRRIAIDTLTIDIASHVVTRDGQEIALTSREFQLLEALALSEGRVLTREAIQERVWGNEESIPKTVDVFIGALRKKIDDGHESKLIHTVRGLGYKIQAGEPQ